MFAKVQDHDNLIRDMQSKAVLNTDKAGLQDYLHKCEQAKKELSDKVETKQRLAKIEEEMSEIKSLLREIAASRSCN